VRRVLCLWFPRWPLQRLLRARPELKRRAVAIYQQQRGLKVVDSNRPGVLPGTPVAEVAGLCWVAHDPAADRRALEELADWCEPFSPIIGLENADPPDSLLLDVTGLGPLFGDEAALAERLARALARQRLRVRLALADTVGAAWALAHAGGEFTVVPSGGGEAALVDLPVAALRLAPSQTALLQELGVQRVGQLLALPRASLARRFGAALLLRVDQALGRVPETIVSHRPSPEVVVERQLEHPLQQREALAQLIAALVEQLARRLAERQMGAIQLACQIVCQPGEAQFVVGLFQPSATARHLSELFQTRLDQIELPGPFVAVRLSVLSAARLATRQRALFDDPQDRRRELALFVDRLSSRLGQGAVLQAALVPDAQPEYAYRYAPLAGARSRRGPSEKRAVADLSRPLLLEPRPIALVAIAVAPQGAPRQFVWRGQSMRVARSWGPERIQTGWWRGRRIRRDYYRVEVEAGDRYWLFRSGGQWFLHGVFD